MWHQDYGYRLHDWIRLRQHCCSVPFDQALSDINDWWWRCPMVNHSLDWHDQTDWPDPWQLLQFAGYCDLARALGMSYTIMMADWCDPCYFDMIHTKIGIFVGCSQPKYTLNWSPGTIVNTPFQDSDIMYRRCINELKNKIG